MALIKCKDCGKDVSQDAIACPQCGNDIQKQVKHDKEKKQREKEKKEHQEALDLAEQVKIWRKNGEICPHCYSHCPGDTCPNCGKSKKAAVWKNIIYGIFAAIGIIFFIVICAKACNPSDKKAPEYAEEEYKCAMKSSATRTCSYSVYANKCKCVTKK